MSLSRSFPEGDEPAHVSASTGDIRHLWSGALVGVAAAALVLWKTLPWDGAVGIDAWAYAAAGQSILGGDLPDFFKSGTTPKPLGTFLGVFAGPFPARVAMSVVMSLAVGSLIAGVFVACLRRTNGWGGAAGVAALLASVELTSMVEVSDGVAAALVVAAVAARRWGRVVLLVAAGLLRPEAWLLAGVAGWSGATGAWRRGVAAIGSAAAAPLLWVMTDLILMGDPLGTVHFLAWARTRKLGGVPTPTDSPGDVAGEFGSLVWGHPAEAIVASLGVVGLVLMLTRGSEKRVDAFPVIVAGLGGLQLFILGILATNMYERYLLPFVLTMLAIGVGHAVGSLAVVARIRVPSVPAAALLVVLGLIAWAWQQDLSDKRHRASTAVQRVEDSSDALREAAACGRVGILGNWRARDHLPIIAASARISWSGLGVVSYDDDRTITNLERFSAIIRLHDGYGEVPEEWTRYTSELAPIATRPGCVLPTTPLRTAPST